MTPTLNIAPVLEPAKTNGSESTEPVKESAAQHSKLPAFMQLILDEKGYKPPVMLQDVGLMRTLPAADSKSEHVVPAGHGAAGLGSLSNTEILTPHAPIFQAKQTTALAQAAVVNSDSQAIPSGGDSSTLTPSAVVELDLDIQAPYTDSDDEDL